MKKYFPWIILAVLIITGAYFLAKKSQEKSQEPSVPGPLDNFAQCLKNSGAVFYGAFWCPHCRDQKSLFGSSVKYLPYVECSTPDGNSQLLICQEKKIEGYPTWEFKDGSRHGGNLSLQELSQKTGCQLPK